MLKLIKIECIKMFKSKLMTISFVMCIASIIAFGLFLKQDSSVDNKDISVEEKRLMEEYDSSTEWKDQLRIQMELNTYLSDIYGDDEIAVKNQILQYRIDHDIEPYEENTTWDFVVYTFDIIGFLISVLAIIFAVEILVREYTNKTTKLLFTKPYSRQMIILSKYITSLVYIVILSFVFFFVAFIVGGLCFTFKGGSVVTVIKMFDTVYQCSVFTESIIYFMSTLVNAVVVMTIAFFISTLSKSQTFPLIFSIGILLFGNIIADKIYSANFEAIRYSILSNLSMSNFINAPVKESYTLYMFVATVFIHVFLLVIGSVQVVKKTDL